MCFQSSTPFFITWPTVFLTDHLSVFGFITADAGPHSIAEPVISMAGNRGEFYRDIRGRWQHSFPIPPGKTGFIHIGDIFGLLGRRQQNIS